MDDILQKAMIRLSKDEDFNIVLQEFIGPELDYIKDVTQDLDIPDGMEKPSIENITISRIIAYKLMSGIFDTITNQEKRANLSVKKNTRYK